MFAINHAATALVIKRRYPDAPMGWLLVSVQLVELLWVVLNFAGVERTTTEALVASVADIRLAFMPYSHSIATSLVMAFLAWLLLEKALRRGALAAAVAVGILSHIVLDLATHTQDIALAPFFGETRLGLGLYDIPPLAFLVEISYGLLCWLLFRGSKGLLAVIVLFNLANLSFFVASMPGPESLLADRPTALVAAVAAQIAITLAAVWYFSRERAAELEHPSRRLARAFA